MDYSEEDVQKVWEKADTVRGYNSAKWRKDKCTAWISRGEYGNRQSKFGWEIDHIKPESEGGTNDLSNLRPLQWQNNAAKQAGKLNCVVVSLGDDNARAQ